MNGRKAKRLRREQARQVDGQFEKMMDIPADLVKSYLMTRFIGCSGCSYVSISKPGAHYHLDDYKDVAIVMVHKGFPQQDQNGAYFAEKDLPKDAVTVELDFPGIVMDKEGHVYVGDAKEPDPTFEFTYELHHLTKERAFASVKDESAKFIEDAEANKDVDELTKEVRLSPDLRNIGTAYVRYILSQKFQEKGLPYGQGEVVDENGNTLKTPEEIEALYHRICPKEIMEGLQERYLTVLYNLMTYYKKKVDTRFYPILNYQMIEYVYDRIRSRMPAKGYSASPDMVTVYVTGQPVPIVDTEADNLIDEINKEIENWVDREFVPTYNRLCKWYSAKLNKNKAYEPSINDPIDELKAWMEKKGFEYGTEKGRECFMTKDEKEVVPYKAFRVFTLMFYRDWQADLLKIYEQSKTDESPEE